MVNLKSPVFLLAGSDGYLKEKTIEELKDSVLSGSSKELDSKVFYGGDSSETEVFDYIATIPFLSAKRLVVIKRFEKVSPEFKSRLIEYIKKPSKSTCLVLESEDESAADNFQSLARYISIHKFDNLKGPAWIRKFLISNGGKRIDEDAAMLLAELQGQNLLSLAQEIGKLISFTGERDTIKIGDVEALVGKSLIASAFDITGAIEERNAKKALEIAGDLIITGKKPHEIIGILCWHFKRILRSKMLKADGENMAGIMNILRISRRYSGEFFKQAERITIPQIKEKMEIILEADIDIKRTKFDQTLILEFAIIRLCLG